jgi:hypothetical protein
VPLPDNVQAALARHPRSVVCRDVCPIVTDAFQNDDGLFDVFKFCAEFRRILLLSIAAMIVQFSRCDLRWVLAASGAILSALAAGAD